MSFICTALRPLSRLTMRHLVRNRADMTRFNRLKCISSVRAFSGASEVEKQKDSNRINVNFAMRDGSNVSVKAFIGDTLLDVIIDNDLDVDGFGACEGTLACSTCHCVLPQDQFDRLEPPTDEELDMLDLAFELCDTSRLGCQVELTREMDGLLVTIPKDVLDARS